MRRRTGLAILVASAVAVALVAAGCTAERGGNDTAERGGNGAAERGDGPAGSSTADSTAATPSERPPVEIPESPAGEALRWVLDHAGTEPDLDEVTARFDETFLASIPASGVQSVLGSVGEAGDLVEMVHAGEHELAVLVELGSEVMQVQLLVEPGPPHRLTGLLFTPAIPTPLPPESIADVEAAWPPLAERASLLVAQVVNGECRPVAAVDPERVGPVGSTAKLYVLGAVATAILDGDLTWDQPVPIRDELKSHPSGTFHELPAGTERTVLEHATAMISQSDNTATDHLVDLVGREAVEAAMVEMGHAAPERNQPFLTTREMFLMKLDGVGEEPLAAYVDGDRDERRALLDEWTGLPLPGLERFSPTPVLIDEVEWFASPADLCRAMVVLGELAEWPGLEPLADILAAPPEVVDADGVTAWFKGGSEPGVSNLTVRLDDGDRVVVASGSLVDQRTVLVPSAGLLDWLVAAGELALG